MGHIEEIVHRQLGIDLCRDIGLYLGIQRGICQHLGDICLTVEDIGQLGSGLALHQEGTYHLGIYHPDICLLDIGHPDIYRGMCPGRPGSGRLDTGPAVTDNDHDHDHDRDHLHNSDRHPDSGLRLADICHDLRHCYHLEN